MAVLKNPRHERFAQQIAKGNSASAAYVDAGYKDNRQAASRLFANVDVKRRVEELTGRAAERAEISKQWVLDRLRENVERAMQHEAPKDESGAIAGEFKYEGSVANRALELLGKELGMFIDRKEIRTGELDDVNADELRSLRSLLASGEEAGAPRASESGSSQKPH